MSHDDTWQKLLSLATELPPDAPFKFVLFEGKGKEYPPVAFLLEMLPEEYTKHLSTPPAVGMGIVYNGDQLRILLRRIHQRRGIQPEEEILMRQVAQACKAGLPLTSEHAEIAYVDGVPAIALSLILLTYYQETVEMDKLIGLNAAQLPEWEVRPWIHPVTREEGPFNTSILLVGRRRVFIFAGEEAWHHVLVDTMEFQETELPRVREVLLGTRQLSRVPRNKDLLVIGGRAGEIISTACWVIYQLRPLQLQKASAKTPTA